MKKLVLEATEEEWPLKWVESYSSGAGVGEDTCQERRVKQHECNKWSSLGVSTGATVIPGLSTGFV